VFPEPAGANSGSAGTLCALAMGNDLVGKAGPLRLSGALRYCGCSASACESVTADAIDLAIEGPDRVSRE